MAKRKVVGTESRLIGWERAWDACDVVWQVFVEEYHRQIEIAMEQAKSAFGDSRLTGATPALSLEKIEECKRNFERLWPKIRQRAEKKLETNWLKKPRKSAKVGKVSSRNKIADKDRSPPRKRGRKKKHRRRGERVRRHVSTGRKRGWNNGKFLGQRRAGRHFTEKERAAAKVRRRHERGKAQRAIRRFRWSKTFKRPFKAYPRKRGE